MTSGRVYRVYRVYNMGGRVCTEYILSTTEYRVVTTGTSGLEVILVEKRIKHDTVGFFFSISSIHYKSMT